MTQPAGDAGPRAIELPLRYYPIPRHAGLSEADFRRATVRRSLPVDSVALVLVDVWDRHFVATHGQRGLEITERQIRPVVEAFRQVGALVVHAPSPQVAKHYARWTPKMTDEEIYGPPAGEEDWPPKDFREKTGPYEPWAPPEAREATDPAYEAVVGDRRIIPAVAPAGEDIVIITGRQLHRVLRQRKVLWLFYAGFAANICMVNRDYGMRAMKVRGYEIVLLRDCTTALEVADTYDALTLSEHFAVNHERTCGFTTTSAELLAACQGVRRP